MLFTAKATPYLFLTCTLLLLGSVSFGQKDMPPDRATSNHVYTKVEVEPEFIGGAGEWSKFISKNLFVPDSCNLDEFQMTVLLKFIVLKTGKLCCIKVIKGGSDCANKQFVKLIKRSNNKWTPAILKGKYVNCYKKMPISVHLENNP